jgi:putative IMPACT (imprinted ancient) family translation regulator
VLVIRWYGGIQLGTGGLARAYGGGANKCLQQAERLPLVNRISLMFDCSFSELALVKLRLGELNGLVEQENFTATGVDLIVALGPEQIDTFQRQLSDISRGRIVLQRQDET